MLSDSTGSFYKTSQGNNNDLIILFKRMNHDEVVAIIINSADFFSYEKISGFDVDSFVLQYRFILNVLAVVAVFSRPHIPCKESSIHWNFNYVQLFTCKFRIIYSFERDL